MAAGQKTHTFPLLDAVLDLLHVLRLRRGTTIDTVGAGAKATATAGDGRRRMITSAVGDGRTRIGCVTETDAIGGTMTIVVSAAG